MKEQLISFETAKLAKEKGFVGLFPTTDYIPMYIEKDDGSGELGEQQGEDDDVGNFYLAPTQSLLQKWLREKHEIHMEFMFDDNIWFGRVGKFCIPDFVYDIEVSIGEKSSYKKSLKAYEEILEKTLYKALVLIP